MRRYPLLFLVIWLLIGSPHPSEAQATQETVFTLENMYQLVLQNHPIAKQANLLSENAQMNIRMARGYFDPKAISNFNGKEFKDKNYYQLWDSHLKVPLWIGQLKVGYERNTGINLNPQSDTNSGKGLAYVGVEIPILKGLLFDERRAALRKAQAMQSEAEAKQVSLINKLILQIAKDYWNWFFTYHQFQLADEGYKLANFRYKAVVDQMRLGALAALDTVEAKITIQQREINLKNAKLAFENAGLILSNHLWDESGNAVVLGETLIPISDINQNLQIEPFEDIIKLANQHPDLRVLNAKYQQLDIERKLNAEMLKPELTFNYNFLDQSAFSDNSLSDLMIDNSFTQNYKAGVSFSVPLFLRKERGKLGMTKVKLEKVRLEQQNLQQQIVTKVGAMYNTMNNFKEVLVMQESMVNNYEQLLSGELQKFNAGESSVFYVNVREGKLLEAQSKLFKIRAELAKSVAELKWAAGLGITL
ncbi:TolC family protein [Sediminitomix flava]|uniref:Outer membrane protein TolC n=1 Tax=Sediminitomix flava TaxID=379075 RepID=A0A315Z9P9_SEDFL|nr:TolC family protein [Sediminitomix flava]PWJ41783.1 outer membrane protein TolC [Sediminitomix flava]